VESRLSLRERSAALVEHGILIFARRSISPSLNALKGLKKFVGGTVTYYYLCRDSVDRAPQAYQDAIRNAFPNLWSYSDEHNIAVGLRYLDNVGGVGTWFRRWDVEASSQKLVPVPPK
jgi:hypothetical protein